MHAAVNFKDFQYSKASIGKHGKGRYSWLEVWSLPADNSSATLKKQHPILTELPTALGVFAYEFLQKQLGLTQEDSLTIAHATVVPVQHKIGRS
jgi:hypothetical protein